MKRALFTALFVFVPFAAGGAEDSSHSRRVERRAVRRAAPPSSIERREALDAMQAAIGQWQRERREFNRAVAAVERLRHTRAAPPTEEPPDEEALSGYGKVIEVPQEDGSEAERAGGEDAGAPSPVEAEVLRMEAELEARRKACEADPERCRKERERRQVVREGNRAWEEALEKKRRAREEAIEAEARRIQAELDAARRREAEERAKRLGGALDAEGNFVDRDLDEEIEADAEREAR